MTHPKFTPSFVLVKFAFPICFPIILCINCGILKRQFERYDTENIELDFLWL